MLLFSPSNFVEVTKFHFRMHLINHIFITNLGFFKLQLLEKWNFEFVKKCLLTFGNLGSLVN